MSKQPVLADKDRVTMTCTFRHEHHGEDPTVTTPLHAHFLSGMEQPYVRKLQVLKDSTPLDTGWVKQPGMFCLENRTGMNRSSNPSEELLEWERQQIIHVYLTEDEENPIIVRPFGGWVVLEVEDVSKVRVRSLGDTINANLMLISK